MKTPNGSINGSEIVSGAGKSSLPTTKPYNEATDVGSNDLTTSGNLFKSNFLSKTQSINFIQKKNHQNQMTTNETDINIILRRRLEEIENQMTDFSSTVYDFASLADHEIQNLTNNMGKLQKNLN